MRNYSKNLAGTRKRVLWCSKECGLLYPRETPLGKSTRTKRICISEFLISCFPPFSFFSLFLFFFFYKNTNTNFSRSINEMKVLLFLFYISRLNGFEVETCLCDTRCNDGVGCGLAYNKHACISLRCSTILQRKTKLFLFFFFFFKRTILSVVIHEG